MSGLKRSNVDNRGEAAASPRKRREGFGLPVYLCFAAAAVLTLVLCVSVGSVAVPFGRTVSIIIDAIAGREQPAVTAESRLALALNIAGAALTDVRFASGVETSRNGDIRLRRPPRRRGLL